MKIFDATSVIAILGDLDRPDLIDRLLMLGHDLAIPKYIAEEELLRENVRSAAEAMTKSGKIKILDETPTTDLHRFNKKFPRVGLGESHVILAYYKMVAANQPAYCILDDHGARAHAAKHNVKHTGLIGLLSMLKEREILATQEIDEITTALKATTFRLPKRFSI